MDDEWKHRESESNERPTMALENRPLCVIDPVCFRPALTLVGVPVSGSVLGLRVIVRVRRRVIHGWHFHGQMLRRLAPAGSAATAAVWPQRASRRFPSQIGSGRVTSNVSADLFGLLRMNCENPTFKESGSIGANFFGVLTGKRRPTFVTREIALKFFAFTKRQI